MCTLYTVHCILYIVHCTLYIVHCTLYTVHCTLYIVHCTLYIVHCTLYIVHSREPNIHNTTIHTPYTPPLTLHLYPLPLHPPRKNQFQRTTPIMTQIIVKFTVSFECYLILHNLQLNVPLSHWLVTLRLLTPFITLYPLYNPLTHPYTLYIH